MQKIVIAEQDHFNRIPQVISDRNSLFPLKRKPLPPFCKYLDFAANKCLPRGINLFLRLSRLIKPSNNVGIRMLCMQRGQNMNLFLGCRVFYGLDGIRFIRSILF